MTDSQRPPAEPTEDDIVLEDGVLETPGDEIIVDAPLDEDTGDPAETGANRDPGADLDSQGVPAYAEEYTPGDPDNPTPIPEPIVPTVPNPDAPVAVFDWGTTANEQRDGEPLDLRLAREEPDPTLDEVTAAYTGEGDADPDARVDDFADDDLDLETGSIVQPDEGVRGDTEKDEVGSLAPRASGDLPAEEAALHVERE